MPLFIRVLSTLMVHVSGPFLCNRSYKKVIKSQKEAKRMILTDFEKDKKW